MISSGERDALLDPLLGRSGSTCFDDTTSRSGEWTAIQIVEDVIFTELTDATREGTAITGMTFSAGSIVLGQFTTIELASGSCIAYKKS